jgi:PKD repeat protein
MLLLAGSVTACSVDSQEAPPLAGPSGLSQSLTLAASPDRLPHDGQSLSVVTVTMRNDSGQPLSGQRVSVGATTGSLSHVDVVTGSDGSAAFVVRAPALSTPADKIDVVVTPFGTNASTALSRTVTIALTGTQNTTAPDAQFIVSPEQPTAGSAAAFDASATTDEGDPCGNGCTYTWTFGDGGSGSGRIVTHTYAAAGVYVVSLNVVDSAGTADSTGHAVTVVAAAVQAP